MDKKYLEIEITETIQEADGMDFRTLINELRQSGFIVSIDDFGTEYANLALLSNVDFDVLKLDRSLVYDVAHNSRARTVVESIIEICRKMNIQVVAEGIETEEQLTVLRACGVELARASFSAGRCPLRNMRRNIFSSRRRETNRKIINNNKKDIPENAFFIVGSV